MSERTKSDGTIDIEAFKNWPDIEAFLTDETDRWKAFDGLVASRGAEAVVQRVHELIAKARQQVRMARQQNNFPAARNQVIAAFSERFSGRRPSSFIEARSFKDLEKFTSFSSALVHEGMRLGVISFADVRDRDDIIGALWEVAPGLQKTAELSRALKQERDNTRRTLRDELQRLGEKDAARLDEWEGKLQDAYAAYVGWARRRSTRWGKLTRSWEDRHNAAARSIRAVEDTYREHMGLKAPVEYWKAKADQHETSENRARAWVIAFFIITLPAMGVAFGATGSALIEKALEIRPQGAPPFPTAIFIIASAGLASCAGLVFWAGRLLTKLYLSQHHLRQDAQERATMTETYLALIENGAATEADRQVILNALFRNTPDGIVKEDGGLDPSIAAALGKFLAKP
ncbi:DUF6161 domain-containing protein [Brevundimonas sp.]|uniref:DUF6161 domain-containing protein n=1 Tax=Brevundimonas sp. TaxID=1871086 RepID=UPI0028A0A67C|nr:DUF6161 domain-containing protein [Brevundimonas sp.]